MNFKKFLISFIIFNVFAAIIPLLVQLFFPEKKYLIPGFWWVFALFAVVNIVFYVIATWGHNISDKASVRAFVGGTSVKFLLWMIFVFVYLRNFAVNGTVFMVNFFYLYLANTVFEVKALISNLRNQNLR